MGSAVGAIKVAAKKTGLSIEEYQAKLASGQLWCTKCKTFHGADDFGLDSTRSSGRAAQCLKSRSTGRPTGVPLGPRINPATGRPGPAPIPARDGDKKQARATINHLIKRGAIPNPNSKPCVDCGHSGDDRRHEYDHYKGYAAEHHLDVQVVCTVCHAARERKIRAERAS